jgi:hypothetical protein
MNGLIHGKMVELQKKLGFLGKDQTVNAGATKYKFRGYEELAKRLWPILQSLGLRMETHIHNFESQPMPSKGTVVTLSMAFQIYAEDGSCHTISAVGHATDSSDKAGNKAMSAAFKYAFFCGLSIPTGEPDMDSERPEVDWTPPAESGEEEDTDFAMVTLVARFAQAKTKAAVKGLIADVKALKARDPEGDYEPLRVAYEEAAERVGL